MVTKRWLLGFLVIAFACLTVQANAENWKDTLETKIEAKWAKTKTGSIDYNRITQPGTVLLVRVDGITADHVDDGSYTMNKVKDGVVRQAGGVAGFLQNKTRSRALKVGEKVYLTKVKADNDNIQLIFLTTELFPFNEEGSTKEARMKSLVKFEFEKGYLQHANFKDIEKALQTVVLSEADAAAANTKTVELGQTPEQVEAALGKPDKVVNLGPKTIFVYKDLKVVFVDGKVSDVQ